MMARDGVNSPRRRESAELQESVGSGPKPDGGSSGAEQADSGPLGNVTSFPQPYSRDLSIRALNVLKIMATELTGECPPRDNWVPSAALLRRMTFNHLATARNCGPRTVTEIIQWAASRGVTIRPPFHAGKSLSAIWRDIGVKFAAGNLSHAEVTEALERSVRRKSTTIPVVAQDVLLQLLKAAGSLASNEAPES
jgi:hypothetical protein